MVLQLHMYLEEQLVDSVEMTLLGYGTNDKVKFDLTDRMTQLKQKHAALIEKANVQPVFYLGNIPSTIRTSRSSKNPYNDTTGGGKKLEPWIIRAVVCSD